MALINHPIVGDTKYESGRALPAENMERRLHLHARRLVIPHPKPGRPPIDITAPLPEHMLATWRLLGLDPGRFEAG